MVTTEVLVYGMMVLFYLKTQGRYVTLSESRCVQSLSTPSTHVWSFLRRFWVRVYAQRSPHSLADKAAILASLECNTKFNSYHLRA